ncbi:MAG: winged helix-turn-helix transcriptional regulator [Dehalococcoidia bacterium]|nr:winged helix-turn-helix transcriptional regulator [Dehalococcoidia bacterium]
MIEILQNKYSATRFEILVEIAASGPNIQQRQIASKLGITPQAISDYIQKMVVDGFVISTGRSSYSVSVTGVNWMLEMLRELRDYLSRVNGIITDITTCAAIAESDLVKGQAVGLIMKDGLLFASPDAGGPARGISLASVKKGQDAGITSIEGLVDLKIKKMTVIQVPAINKGGSAAVDLHLLKSHLSTTIHIGAIGIEALVALRRAGFEPKYQYGVSEAAIEAVHCGLPVVIVCTADAFTGLLKKIHAESLDYELVDLTKET